MVGLYLENAKRSHTKSRTQMDSHRKRSKGRPKTTWRRYIIADLSDMGLTMGDAQDCKRWENGYPSECDSRYVILWHSQDIVQPSHSVFLDLAAYW